MKARELKMLEAEVESSGLKPGTEEYERALRERKVELCKSYQQVNSCWDCPAFDGCSLVKKYIEDMRTGPVKRD